MDNDVIAVDHPPITEVQASITFVLLIVGKSEVYGCIMVSDGIAQHQISWKLILLFSACYECADGRTKRT